MQKQIWRLRSRLGDAAPVNHRASGYALEIDGQAIDSRRFEELLKRARLALGRDEPEQASADLREALALWRGAPLETMRQARELLVDQLGIEPGPELRRLEGMILRWDAR